MKIHVLQWSFNRLPILPQSTPIRVTLRSNQDHIIGSLLYEPKSAVVCWDYYLKKARESKNQKNCLRNMCMHACKTIYIDSRKNNKKRKKTNLQVLSLLQLKMNQKKRSHHRIPEKEKKLLPAENTTWQDKVQNVSTSNRHSFSIHRSEYSDKLPF